MRSALRCRAAGSCLALLAAVSSPVTVSRAEESGTQAAAVRETISEDAAVAMVREQTDGKVVRVDRKIEGGSVVYRIRVVSPDGRLREFRVDAATGSML